MARTKQSSTHDSMSGSKFTAMKQPKKMIPASHSPQASSFTPSGQGQPLDFHSSTTNQPTRNKKKRKKFGDDDGDDDDDDDYHPSSDYDDEDTTTLTIKKGATGIATSHKTTSSASATLSKSIGTAPTGMVVLPPAAAPAAASLKSTVSDDVGKRAVTRARATNAALLKSTGKDTPHAAAPAAASLKSSSDTIATAAAAAVDKKPKATKRVTLSTIAASSTPSDITLDGMVPPPAATATTAAAVAKKPKAEKPKATKSKKPKEAMKQVAQEYEKATDKDAWIKTCEPAKDTLPKKYENCKIDNVRVYDMTTEAIRAIPLKQVPDFSGQVLCALMKKIGGKLYNLNINMLRSAFTEYLQNGKVEKGFSNNNRAEGMKTTLAATCNLAKPDEANPLFSLLTLATDPDLSSMMKHLVSIELTRIVINETPDGQAESNLQKITNAMGLDSIKNFLVRCTQMNFVIGPSSHGYYSGVKARSAAYERQSLELIHPDITQNIEPNNNISSMRKFF